MFKTFSLLFKQANFSQTFLSIFEFTSIIVTMRNFLSVFFKFPFQKINNV